MLQPHRTTFHVRHWSRILWLDGIALLTAILPTVACQWQPPLRAIVEKEFARQRFIYPRVSIWQAYRPCSPDIRLPEEQIISCREWAPRERELLYRTLAATTRQEADRETLHAQALAWLILGRINLALRTLTKAVVRLPDDADLWNDLGVLEYIVAQGEPRRLSAAVENFERALSTKPNHSSAQFNLALSLEGMGLTTEAFKAWNDFLDGSYGDFGWKKEALEHRERLLPGLNPPLAPGDPAAPTILKSKPRALHTWLMRTMLRSWPAAVQDGDPARASEVLTAAQEAANILRPLGDRLASDVVEAVLQVPSDDRNLLAESYTRVARGEDTLRQSQPATALGALDQALPLLLERNHSLAGEIRYLKASAYFAQGKYDRTEQELDLLFQQRSGDPSVMARGQFLLGLTHYVTGDPNHALPMLREVVERFPQFGPQEDLAYAEILLGECLDILGDSRAAWRYLHRGALRVQTVWDPYRRVQVLNSLADLSLRQGNIRLSYRYQNAAVRWARSQGNASFLADVLLWRSILRYRLADVEGAQVDLQQASAEIAKIEDADRRRLDEADFHLIQGISLADRNPALALEALSDAIDVYEAEQHWPNLLLASEARAGVSRSLADVRREHEDLERSLTLYEQIGSAALEESFRIALGPTFESALDQFVRFEVEQGRYRSGLAQLLRGKEITQPIPGAVKKEHRPSVHLIDEIQGSLPDGVALVTYCVLADRTLLWELRRDRFGFHESPLGATALEETLEALLDARQRADGHKKASEALYRDLVAPWFQRDSDHTVVFVPDKALFRLPFALLRDSASGRYVVEDARIAVSPAPQWVLFGPRRDTELRTTHPEPNVLLVADPAFDSRHLPDLERLHEAQRAGNEIQKLFPHSSKLLLGEAATAEAFTAGISGAQFIDFSGHAVASSSAPLDSFLALAPSAANETGTLTARGLYDLPLGDTRLITLSACRTGASLPGQWPAALQLARPFLDAGVPSVIASLWEVDDRKSAKFIVSFYRNLSTDLSPLSAFQAAQLAALRSNGAATGRQDWAAFELFGAPALSLTE